MNLIYLYQKIFIGYMRLTAIYVKLSATGLTLLRSSFLVVIPPGMISARRFKSAHHTCIINEENSHRFLDIFSTIL